MLVEDVVSMTQRGEFSTGQALGHLRAIGCTPGRAHEILAREGLLEVTTTPLFADSPDLTGEEVAETVPPRFNDADDAATAAELARFASPVPTAGRLSTGAVLEISRILAEDGVREQTCRDHAANFTLPPARAKMGLGDVRLSV